MRFARGEVQMLCSAHLYALRVSTMAERHRLAAGGLTLAYCLEMRSGACMALERWNACGLTAYINLAESARVTFHHCESQIHDTTMLAAWHWESYRAFRIDIVPCLNSELITCI